MRRNASRHPHFLAYVFFFRLLERCAYMNRLVHTDSNSYRMLSRCREAPSRVSLGLHSLAHQRHHAPFCRCRHPSTYGAEFIGLLISAILYGVTLIQTWHYYYHYYHRDRTLLKAVVGLLLFMDTLHTALCIYTIYWYLILNFGNVPSLDFNMWAVNTQLDLNGAIAVLVQFFYARRVFLMSKNAFLTGVILIFSSMHFSLGVVFTVKAFALKRFSLYNSLIWITCLGMSAATAADIIIATSMCWYLYHKRTGFAKTDSMIMTLMSYSVNTGLLTSIIATATLICFAITPTSFVWQAFFWTLGKCYINSFLAILNSRDILRERATGSMFGMSPIRIEQPLSESYESSGIRPAVLAVSVQKSITTDFAQGKFEYESGSPVDSSKSVRMPRFHTTSASGLTKGSVPAGAPYSRPPVTCQRIPSH
ncbi:hypothetical protein BC834DRAFT_284661 [Gloeopeniophorella convolvens]|nr:hypothetical protein BC834DRAFT_284661 [Gloeopeniophorella convolvens]